MAERRQYIAGPVVPPGADEKQTVDILLRWVQDQSKVIEDNIQALYNRGVMMSENTDDEVLDCTFDSGADTEHTFPHTLGRIPLGFIPEQVTLVGSIRGMADGSATNQSTAWTTTDIYLVSDINNQIAKIRVY